jgi:ATP-dependent Clp protease ATP-binding subunit ClpC
MKLYQIYVPELATYVKYKVLDPDSIESLIEELDNKSPKDFKLAVLENVIYNVKPEITESLRMMSREAAERCIDAMYHGCVMLNPGIDIDLWIELAYAKSISDKDVKDFQNLSNIESEIAKHLQSKFETRYEPKSKQKVKKITRQKFLGLQEYLQTNVIGQQEAINSVISSLKRSQVGLNDKNRPLGIFLFAGASGVGKTHLATLVHRYMFSEEYPIVRIDCGEFQHKHENQKLIGSPPGYVGHDEGGQLVNQVKKYPHTVVLLDEVEKAHQDIWNTFLRVFEDGMLTDGKGERVDFRNTIIIMTTNLGNEKTVDFLLSGGAGFARPVGMKHSTKEFPSQEMVNRNTLDAIRKHFRPEFINRLDKIIVFNHLSKTDLQKIAELEMSVIIDKLSKKGYIINYTDSVIDALLEKGIDSIKGARGLAQIRREKMEDQLADILIKSVPPRGTIFEISYTPEDDFIFTLKKPSKTKSVDK